MFWKHVLAFSTWSPLTPFCAPPDGAGDGGTPAVGGSDAPAGDEGAGDDSLSGDAPADNGDDEPAARVDGGRDDDPDDDDDEDRELDALPVEERAKRLRTRLRRYQRQQRSMRPIAEMFRDGSGRLMSPQEVQRRLSSAADWDEMNQFLQEHPDIVGQILERKNRGSRGAAPDTKPTAFVDPFADESKLPFDTTTEAGRFIVDNLRATAKQNFELRQLIDELRNGVTDVRRRDSARTLQQVEASWKSSTLAAAKEAGLDPADTELFVERVWNVFERGKFTKSLHRLKVDQVIKDKLAAFKGRRRAAVAGQQNRAERGRTVPPPAGRGKTTVATAADRNNVGGIKEARKSLFTRLGMSAPPR
jgi:hypothetical protein